MFFYATWLICSSMRHGSYLLLCDMAHMFFYATWLISSSMRHGSYVLLCDMAHKFFYVTWLISSSMRHGLYVFLAISSSHFIEKEITIINKYVFQGILPCGTGELR